MICLTSCKRFIFMYLFIYSFINSERGCIKFVTPGMESDVIVHHFKLDLTSPNCVTYAIAQVALHKEKGTVKGRSDDRDSNAITQCSQPTEKAGGFYFVSVGKVIVYVRAEFTRLNISLPVLLQTAYCLYGFSLCLVWALSYRFSY